MSKKNAGHFLGSSSFGGAVASLKAKEAKKLKKLKEIAKLRKKDVKK